MNALFPTTSTETNSRCTTLNRKRRGADLDHSHTRQRIETPQAAETDSQIAVVMLTFDELLENFSKVIKRGVVDYQTSVDRLKQHTITIENEELPLFTPNEGVEANSTQLWISVANGTNEVWLSMQLYKGPYDSNLIAEKQFYPDVKEGTQYDFLSVHEEDNTLLFNVRCGEKGDLIYLNKGSSLSGDKVKEICFKVLESFPFTHQLYLYDDARIGNIRLSTTLCLAAADAKAWYERNGCTAVSCENWQTTENHTPHSQDANAYCQAVVKLRSLTLNFFIQMLGGPDKKLVGALIKKHFPDTHSKDLSLHMLVNALHNASKQARIIGEGNAPRELATFHDKFFTIPRPLPNPITELKNKFFDALIKINNTILWERTFDFSL